MNSNSKLSLTGFLVYLKHNLPFVWKLVAFVNSLLFSILHKTRFQKATNMVIKEHALQGFVFREIGKGDLPELEWLLASQSPQRVAFFKPHDFHARALLKAYNDPAFLMMGVFDGSRMAGYFFLRCFWNRKCFVGRLIDEPFEGKGIGRVMNDIMYHISWEAEFHCLSTISKNNRPVMRSHAKNPHLKILSELPNDYLLVEFVPSLS